MDACGTVCHPAGVQQSPSKWRIRVSPLFPRARAFSSQPRRPAQELCTSMGKERHRQTGFLGFWENPILQFEKDQRQCCSSPARPPATWKVRIWVRVKRPAACMHAAVCPPPFLAQSSGTTQHLLPRYTGKRDSLKRNMSSETTRSIVF